MADSKLADFGRAIYEPKKTQRAGSTDQVGLLAAPQQDDSFSDDDSSMTEDPFSDEVLFPETSYVETYKRLRGSTFTGLKNFTARLSLPALPSFSTRRSKQRLLD